MRYLDFDVAIERAGEGYRARVIRSPSGEAEAHFRAPLTDVELRDFASDVVGVRTAIRGAHAASTDRIKAYGALLYEAVFGGEVQHCLLRSLEQVRETPNAGMRIRLRFGDAPELAKLPWEFAYRRSVRRYLALTASTPIVRYLDLPESPRPLATRLPLRILVMISSPREYEPLNAEAEWNSLKTALAPLEAEERVVLHRLDAATLDALRWQLRKEEYHVFHFIGHGDVDPVTRCGVLILEDEDEKPVRVSAERLGVMLHEEDTLRLAILNTCEGAHAADDDLFAGTAQTLVQQGIPAVIAMQFPITDASALIFARDFYKSIAFGDPVDAAMSQARQAIYARNELEWGTPVLYMRAPSGQLFEFDAGPAHPADTHEGSPPTRRRVAPPTRPRQPAHETHEEQLARVLVEVRAAITSEDWERAAGRAGAALELDPANEEAAALARRARDQQELSTLYESGCRHLEAHQWRDALKAFWQLRARSATYKDLDARVRLAQHELARQIEAEERARTEREIGGREREEAGRTAKRWRLVALVVAGGGALALLLVLGWHWSSVPSRDDEMAKLGFLPAAEPIESTLRDGRTESSTIALDAQREYRIAGSCDGDCRDLNLRLLGPAGETLAVDTASHKLPELDVKPREAGSYTLVVHMAQCSVSPCGYRYRVYAKAR